MTAFNSKLAVAWDESTHEEKVRFIETIFAFTINELWLLQKRLTRLEAQVRDRYPQFDHGL